jgi:hypothetical protein
MLGFILALNVAGFFGFIVYILSVLLRYDHGKQLMIEFNQAITDDWMKALADILGEYQNDNFISDDELMNLPVNRVH